MNILLKRLFLRLETPYRHTYTCDLILLAIELLVREQSAISSAGKILLQPTIAVRVHVA
jgi:hypothetical protein